MKLVKNLVSLTLLCFGILTSASAKNINIEHISPTLNVIQVAALKVKNDIFTKNEYFFAHETFIINSNDYVRYFIVNIQDEDFFSLLSKIKIEYPSAFKANEKINKLLKSKHKPIHKKLTFLNSQTILKTRKKFF